ncbi:MAG: deoxyribose-phosphate aldolase [Erysipelotrichales bacterium]|nr:MAG: deoxyribose-phosphate aldolase [Erysipelotrichales bacterium]
MIDVSKLDKHAAGKLFDHSVLPKQTTEKEIREGCKEAIKYNCAAFYSANPYYTPVVVEELKGTDILIGCGIGFPFGSQPSAVKAFETRYAVEQGCTVVDMVMNVGAMKDKNFDVIRQELKDFKEAAGKAITKVILEVCYLTDEEIALGAKMVAEAGIDYCKTSSGQFEGPTMQQFLIMKKALEGTPVRLKVSGVKFPRPQNAWCFIMAGAELIGTRSAPEIIEGLEMCREIGIVPKLAK